jgi:hypothetical protein
MLKLRRAFWVFTNRLLAIPFIYNTLYYLAHIIPFLYNRKRFLLSLLLEEIQ